MKTSENYSESFMDRLMARIRRAYSENGVTIPFERRAIRNYLDRCIKAWREKEEAAGTLEDVLIARSYIDAFQSVRFALFGKILLKK